jgi:hypothetical protein
MQTYKIISFRGEYSISRADGENRSSSIPCNLENTDCAKFLQDWKDGAEVLDADGNPLPYSDEALASFGIVGGNFP